MLNNFKLNFISAKLYLIEVILFDILFSVIIYLIVKNSFAAFSLILIFLLSSILLLNYLARKRNKELGEIKRIINGIRKNEFSDSNEIRLSDSLSTIQEDIKKNV